MKILLITSNATIEKLFVLSAEKKGDEVIVGQSDNISDDVYDAVFIDKDLYTEELYERLKNDYPNAKFVLILSKKDEKIVGFNEYLTKPFLPTDLMDLLDKLPNIKEDTEHSDDDLDIESFDDLKDLDFEESGNDELGDLDDLGDDLDFDLDDDFNDDLELDLDTKTDEKNNEQKDDDLEVEPLEETEENKQVDIEDMFEDIESEEDLKDLDAKEEFGKDEEGFEISEEELEGEAPDDDIEENFEIDENELLDDVDEEPAETAETQNDTDTDGLNIDEFDLDDIQGEGTDTAATDETDDMVLDTSEESSEHSDDLKEDSEILENENFDLNDIGNSEKDETDIETASAQSDENIQDFNLDDIEGENIEKAVEHSDINDEKDLESLKLENEKQEVELETNENNKEVDDMNFDEELEQLNEAELAQVLGEELPEEFQSGAEKTEEEDVVDEDFEPEEEVVLDEKIPEVQEVHELEEAINHPENITPQEKTLGGILNINWEELKKAKAKVTITIDFGD